MPPNNLIDLDSAVERIKACPKGDLVLFLGAGISKEPPSNCPNELLNSAINPVPGIYDSLKAYYELVAPNLDKINKKPELSYQILYENLLDDFFGFLDILDHGHPNINHSAVASIAYEYECPLIFTINFDENIEERLKMRAGVHIGSSSEEIQRSIECNEKCAYPYIVKMHGTISDKDSIILTLRQAGRELKPDLAELLGAVLKNKTILVVGCSGNDDDIFPVFLQNAKESKSIFWVFWDKDLEKQFTPNLALLSEIAQEKCTFIRTDKTPILPRIPCRDALVRDNQTGDTEIKIENTINIHASYLSKWVKTISEDVWKNTFSELIFLHDYNNDTASFIARDMESIICNSHDQLAVTRAYKNLAFALMKKNEHKRAWASLSRAADNFMARGNHREVIECLTLMTTEIPIADQGHWKGDDPLSWSAHLAGKIYEPYSNCLYNYAAGVHMLHLPQKEKFAEDHLLTAGGFAKKCGDRIMLVKCLIKLKDLYENTNQKELNDECCREIKRQNMLLGKDVAEKPALDDSPSAETKSPELPPEEKIIQKCMGQVPKNNKRNIIGESIIVLVIALVMTGLYSLVRHGFRERIWIFVILLVTGAAGKLWYFIKRYRYPQIVRS